MKKTVLLLLAMMIASQTLYAGVKEKIYVVPNASASLVNKAVNGTNDNVASVFGGISGTVKNAVSDVNEFGKSVYRGLLGGEVE